MVNIHIFLLKPKLVLAPRSIHLILISDNSVLVAPILILIGFHHIWNNNVFDIF